jgi:hypothetical protein
MNKQNQSPSLWHDLGAVAGLYQGVLTLMTRRLKYGPDWPGPGYDDPPPPPQVQPTEERELVSAGRR